MLPLILSNNHFEHSELGCNLRKISASTFSLPPPFSFCSLSFHSIYFFPSPLSAVKRPLSVHKEFEESCKLPGGFVASATKAYFEPTMRVWWQGFWFSFCAKQNVHLNQKNVMLSALKHFFKICRPLKFCHPRHCELSFTVQIEIVNHINEHNVCVASYKL